MGDRPLSRAIGVRFTVDVLERLEKINNKQAFIREAVEEKLNRES